MDKQLLQSHGFPDFDNYLGQVREIEKGFDELLEKNPPKDSSADAFNSAIYEITCSLGKLYGKNKELSARVNTITEEATYKTIRGLESYLGLKPVEKLPFVMVSDQLKTQAFECSIAMFGHDDYEEVPLSYMKSTHFSPKSDSTHDHIAQIIKEEGLQKGLPVIAYYLPSLSIESIIEEPIHFLHYTHLKPKADLVKQANPDEDSIKLQKSVYTEALAQFMRRRLEISEPFDFEKYIGENGGDCGKHVRELNKIFQEKGWPACYQELLRKKEKKKLGGYLMDFARTTYMGLPSWNNLFVHGLGYSLGDRLHERVDQKNFSKAVNLMFREKDHKLVSDGLIKIVSTQRRLSC